MDNGVSPQAAPSLLTGRILIAVVDGHTEAKLDSASQFIELERRFGQLDFVNGAFCFRVTRHNRLSPPWSRLVHSDDVGQGAFDTAERVVVESDLAIASCICNHELD